MRPYSVPILAFGLFLLGRPAQAETCAHDFTTWATTPSRAWQEPAITRDQPIESAKVPVLTSQDPDHTGYLMINNWAEQQSSDRVGVHLNPPERERLTTNRVQASEKLRVAFGDLTAGFRPLLDDRQQQGFDQIMACTDTLAYARGDEHEHRAWKSYLLARLHLNGPQIVALTPMLDELETRSKETFAAYTSNFQETLAMAERRVAQERLRRSLGTENP